MRFSCITSLGKNDFKVLKKSRYLFSFKGEHFILRVFPWYSLSSLPFAVSVPSSLAKATRRNKVKRWIREALLNACRTGLTWKGYLPLLSVKSLPKSYDEVYKEVFLLLREVNEKLRVLREGDTRRGQVGFLIRYLFNYPMISKEMYKLSKLGDLKVLIISDGVPLSHIESLQGEIRKVLVEKNLSFEAYLSSFQGEHMNHRDKYHLILALGNPLALLSPLELAKALAKVGHSLVYKPPSSGIFILEFHDLKEKLFFEGYQLFRLENPEELIVSSHVSFSPLDGVRRLYVNLLSKGKEEKKLYFWGLGEALTLLQHHFEGAKVFQYAPRKYVIAALKPRRVIHHTSFEKAICVDLENI